jgi:hypothetical protein
MLLYIAATPQVVSTVLVVEQEEEGKIHGVQRPIYFLSEVLSPSKQRYPHYQKLAYGVFMSAKKLRHYFSAHQIIVVNEAPLSNILNNPEATRHVSRSIFFSLFASFLVGLKFFLQVVGLLLGKMQRLREKERMRA